jgi:hypothetical protein
MKNVRKILMAALMAGVLSLGAFVPLSALAQKNNNNRPPKDPGKVKTPDKEPRGNTNSSGNRNKP